jgi:hypothetical protein
MLTFRTLDARRATEPTDWVEFHDAKIHISTRPDAIAHYVSGHWIYDGARCSYIECRVLLTLHFKDSARGACSIGRPVLRNTHQRSLPLRRQSSSRDFVTRRWALVALPHDGELAGRACAGR